MNAIYIYKVQQLQDIDKLLSMSELLRFHLIYFCLFFMNLYLKYLLRVNFNVYNTIYLVRMRCRYGKNVTCCLAEL